MRMLRILALVTLVLITVLLFYNGPKQRAPRYNPATEVKVEGTVEEVQQYWCPISGDEGTHLVLKTDVGVLAVHVAPVRFLLGNGVNLGKGDQVEVVGSMVIYGDRDAMIARKITRGDQTFAFRQPDGRPLWVEHWPNYAR